MITKKHIRQYLDKLSPGIPANQGQLFDQVWQQLHEYIVKHYKRLDKGARAYADEIFDQLDRSVKKRMDSLPKGREKKVWSRKLSMVRGERSPIPVLYLDTPVIENLIRQGLGQVASQPKAGNPAALYKQILALVSDSKLICPEDTLHREALQMGGGQAQEALNIMRRLSGGLSFQHSQTIEDFQVFRALRGFISGNGSIAHRSFWKDAFQKQTVSTIMKKRSAISFEGPLALGETPGAGTIQQERAAPHSTTLRIRYDETLLNHDHQLQKRSARHLRDLVRLGLKYQTVKGKTQGQHLDGFWAGQKTDLAVALWNLYGGKPEGLAGLASFYESGHFMDVPAIKIKRDLWHAFSVNHGQSLRRVPAPPSINLIPAILPYTDMMILDSEMTLVVRDRLGLNTKFDTQIYRMDEHDRIVVALKEMGLCD
jgi:hypothetical protein